MSALLGMPQATCTPQEVQQVLVQETADILRRRLFRQGFPRRSHDHDFGVKKLYPSGANFCTVCDSKGTEDERAIG